VTGTVPSLPLIAASIMSKKLAAGADAIVLDVKCGKGAFMETLEDARALSRIMVAIGSLAGRKTTALITQMEQPLGRAVGNALEVQEAIDTLRGKGPADFQELVETISVEMLLIANAVADRAQAQHRVRRAINSGAALAKFADFVQAQGGDGNVVEEPFLLPFAPVEMPVNAPAEGCVHAIDARAIGLAVVALGGGRQKKGDPIDPSVGVMVKAKVGDRVAAGDLLCTVHAADEASAHAVAKTLVAAYTLGPDAVPPLPILLDRIAAA
jgi:pyrimidine-nucleoside phosphorylase